MSYTRAKSTKLLATHCIICNRSLRDAESVELGIGPVCRDKYGFNAKLAPAKRKKANALIHEAAVVQAKDAGRVVAIADELDKLSLSVIADKIRDRFIEIRIVRTWGGHFRWNRDKRAVEQVGVGRIIKVYTPYHPDFARAMGGCRTRRSCYLDEISRYSGKQKFSHWEVEEAEGSALQAALVRCFPGRAGLTTDFPTKASKVGGSRPEVGAVVQVRKKDREVVWVADEKSGRSWDVLTSGEPVTKSFNVPRR